MQVEIVTPERTILSCQAEQVLVPGTKAPFAMLKGHQAIISSLEEKKMVITQPGGQKVTVQLAGACVVEQHEDRVTILATRAEVLQ